MQKIQLSIDATKIDKTLMRAKDNKPTYLEVDVIPLKEKKQKAKQDGTLIQGLKDGKVWRLMKTHFVVQSNKDKTVKMPIIGEGTVFEYDQSAEEPLPDPVKAEAKDDFDVSSIPF